jgi:DMSO/TMAO reductase YedYZ heme-binding membrane subunit
VNLAWYVSRAAGLVSWAILALSIGWGLLLSSRVLGRRPGPRWLLDVHRFLGGLGVVLVAVHVLALLADEYVSFTPTQLLVPLASDYRPAAVAAGVVALYLLVAVEVTSLARRWLPRRVWRGVHLLSYGLYALGTVHLLAAGTDATNPAVLAVVVVVTVGLAVATAAHAAHLSGRRSSGSSPVLAPAPSPVRLVHTPASPPAAP